MRLRIVSGHECFIYGHGRDCGTIKAVLEIPFEKSNCRKPLCCRKPKYRSSALHACGTVVIERVDDLAWWQFA